MAYVAHLSKNNKGSGSWAIFRTFIVPYGSSAFSLAMFAKFSASQVTPLFGLEDADVDAEPGLFFFKMPRTGERVASGVCITWVEMTCQIRIIR